MIASQSGFLRGFRVATNRTTYDSTRDVTPHTFVWVATRLMWWDAD